MDIEEAKGFLNETCMWEEVKLDVDDREQFDPHYRILAVVYVNETNLNEELVKEGYAKAMYIPPSEFDPDTVNAIIAAAAILFALLGGFITQYMLTRNEKIIGHLSTDYHHLRDTLYLFNSEPLYGNPDKSKKILGPILDYLAYVCQLWYIPAVQGGYLRKAVLEADQANDLKKELKEHFLDTAKKFEESRSGVRAFPSGLFGFVLVILILLAGITLVGLWIKLMYEPTSLNPLFFLFYLAFSFFFVLFFFFIYDLKRLDAFFVIPLINKLLKRLFIRYLIFASTDNDEKTRKVYKKNVGEYLEIVKTAYDDYEKFSCIQDETRKRSLDKAEKIAEQFLDEREKRHEDREKEVDLKKREKMKEDWEEKVEWTVPEAATEVLLRQWLFKGAYFVFGVLFVVVLMCPGCPCVCWPSWACLVLLWCVKAILVVFLLVVPFRYVIGNMKKPSLLKDLPVCWDVIIDIEQEYELEHKQQEKDIKKRPNTYKDVKKDVEKEIGKRMKKCMKSNELQFR